MADALIRSDPQATSQLQSTCGYEFSRYVSRRETLFRGCEIWADLASLEAYFQATHMSVIREALSKIDLKSPKVSRFLA